MNLLEAVKEVILQMEADIKDTICGDCEPACKHHVRLLKVMVKMADVPVAHPNNVRLQGTADPVGVREVYVGEGDPPGYGRNRNVQPKPNEALHGYDPWEEAKRRDTYIPHEPKAGER